MIVWSTVLPAESRALTRSETVPSVSPSGGWVTAAVNRPPSPGGRGDGFAPALAVVVRRLHGRRHALGRGSALLVRHRERDLVRAARLRPGAVVQGQVIADEQQWQERARAPLVRGAAHGLGQLGGRVVGTGPERPVGVDLGLRVARRLYFKSSRYTASCGSSGRIWRCGQPPPSSRASLVSVSVPLR